MPPKAQCFNPVFTAWLEEMRDAFDPESNYWKTYNRAVKSMRAHPKCLEHPRECIEVKYVGPKIRDRLVEKHESQAVKSQGIMSSGAVQKPCVPETSIGRSYAYGQKTSADWPFVGSTKAVPLQNNQAQETITSSTVAEELFLILSSDSERHNLSGPGGQSQLRKIIPSQRTPTVPKRTKPAPARPRLPKAIPAPPATSDVEPENGNGSTAHDVGSDPIFSSFEPLVFPAGSYSIQLILDEREIRSTNDRDYMLNGLRKRGVEVTKRSLEIGDVCWVARLDEGIEGSCTECVLDYVVERKRMDDLKGSILDGRFHEQKFRLKHTGISHVYYLVEDYDSGKIARQWREQINTALSSTQVIDNFFLKETATIEDTLDYLSGLHRTIIKLHKNKPLHVIPPDLAKRHSFLALKHYLATTHPGIAYHTTYNTYQRLNQKNGFYTLQDCMARMLQCIRGLSEEKIARLVQNYPTPRSLYEAFVEAEERYSMGLDERGQNKTNDVNEREKKARAVSARPPELMLAELGGRGRQKIGPTLSKHIYEVFMACKYGS